MTFSPEYTPRLAKSELAYRAGFERKDCNVAEQGKGGGEGRRNKEGNWHKWLCLLAWPFFTFSHLMPSTYTPIHKKWLINKMVQHISRSHPESSGFESFFFHISTFNIYISIHTHGGFTIRRRPNTSCKIWILLLLFLLFGESELWRTFEWILKHSPGFSHVWFLPVPRYRGFALFIRQREIFYLSIDTFHTDIYKFKYT